MTTLDEELIAAARGGRVRSTGFLDPEDADRLLAALRVPGVGADAWGGFHGARRRAVTARPDHVPEARPTLTAVYLAGVRDAHALRAALHGHGAPVDALGDVVEHQDGLSVITLDPPPEAATATLDVAGRVVSGERVPLKRVARGTRREVEAVVASLRLDALGARAFGVSRSYFAKGVRAGRVRIDGRTASVRDEAAPGAEVWAEGLGRFRVAASEGQTRRGNRRVRLEVER